MYFKKKTASWNPECCNLIQYLFSRSCCSFLLREEFSEYESYKRTCVKDLPEECHREVHCCCLKPCRDELAYRCMFDQQSCCKAHTRTHKCYGYCWDCKYKVERIVSSHIHNAKCSLLCKSTDDKKSRTKAIGPMNVNSWKANRNVSFVIVPVFSTIL